jgi:uncharacterized protein (DUF362 family)
MRRLSRRDVLKSAPLAVIAAAACRQTPYRRSDFAVPGRSPMAILPAASYEVDLEDVVFRGLQLLQVSVRGRSVLLKPNAVEYESGSSINTHPSVVAAAARAFLSAGARDVIVAEGPGHRRDIEYLLTATGLYDVIRELRLKFVDLNHDDVRLVPLKSHYTELDALWLPEAILRADFIVSMPKLKTHHWAGMTGSMKNLFGAVPGAVYGWPKNLLHFKGIEQSILDLTATIRPHLAIVDAIVAMEGDGPIMGRPRPLGFIAMGADLPAVDATCARIIGLNPAKMPYLKVGGRYLGNIESDKIEQRGEQASRYVTRFDVVDRIKGLQL